MPPELLRHVRLLNPLTYTDQVVDVLIEDGVIQAIAPQIHDYPDQAEMTDCTGFILGPGLVDLYSTVGEPGFESRETLNSIAAAAVAGGFTRVALLPSTHPAVDSAEQVEWRLAHSPHHLPVQLQSWAALTQNLEGQKLVELSELANTAICGFSDGQPLKPGTLVRHALDYLKPLQTKPSPKCIMLWPCDRALAANGVIREGIQALQTGLPENPVMAETTALAALLEIIETVQIPIHIMRVSTARSVEILKVAKDRGLPITASTTWMHLLWNSEDLRSYDVNLRLDPPLGNPSDQEALILGLETGVIDAIAIDHQPHTYEEKTVPFAEAPPGVIGLELALPLLWQTFVTTQRWSALDLWAKLSINPLKILNQPQMAIAENQRGEMTLFDPTQPLKVTAASLQSLSINTPWIGSNLIGRAVKTWQG
jgi:dihydroorotase